MTAATVCPDAGTRLGPKRMSPDWGRVVMIPLSTVFGSLAVLQLMTLLTATKGAPLDVAVAAVTGLLTTLFYVLIVWAYLRRGPASATTRVLGAVVAAPVATFLPFALPFTGTGHAPGLLLVVGNLMLVAGLAFAVWSVRCLDRSLSVVAQARQLVEHGPYAWIRHPLYLGELIAMLGLALTLGGLLPLLGWLGLAVLQAYRAVHEERLLHVSLPGYESYRRRTTRIIPAVF